MTQRPAPDLAAGLSSASLDLHPFCHSCGWRKGGLHSWNGRACKCGHSEPSFRVLFADYRGRVGRPDIEYSGFSEKNEPTNGR